MCLEQVKEEESISLEREAEMDHIGTLNPQKESRCYSEDKGKSLKSCSQAREDHSLQCNLHFLNSTF